MDRRLRRCHFAQCEMTGRGKPLPYRGAVFFAPSLRGLSADQADWGSVVLKEYTPSVFGYAKSTSLKEGGKWIALRRCHFAVQNDRTVEGSEGSAAGGRYSDPSEWQRSVFSEERRRRRKIPGTATGAPVPTGSIGVRKKQRPGRKAPSSFFILHSSFFIPWLALSLRLTKKCLCCIANISIWWYNFTQVCEHCKLWKGECV